MTPLAAIAALGKIASKPSETLDDRSLINTHVARVEVHSEELAIQFAQEQKSNRRGMKDDGITLRIPWHKIH
jgi:hypothetical protein